MTDRLIHAHIYNPCIPGLFKSGANERAKCFKITCSAESCELLDRGQCARRFFLKGACPHGRTTEEEGPTKRAQRFSEWIAARRAATAGIPCLDTPPDKLARVGDHVWLPYPHMDYLLTGRVFGPNDLFVPATDFTPAYIAKLCNGRPHSLMGGEICSYQEKVIPLFVAHLEEAWPDLLAQVLPLSERAAELVGRPRVGRKALLRTLLPGAGAFARHEKDPAAWAWDGEYLTATDAKAFPPFTPFGAVEVRIRPALDAVVTTTEAGQIGPDTVFMD